MFKLNPNPTFEYTVPISIPGGESLPLRVVFKHKKKSELKEFMASAGRSDSEMLTEMIHACKDKPDDVSLSDYLLEVTENYPAASSDILRSYLKELSESRIKN